MEEQLKGRIALVGFRDFLGQTGKERFEKRLMGYARGAQKFNLALEYVDALNLVVSNADSSVRFDGEDFVARFDGAIFDNTTGGFNVTLPTFTYMKTLLYYFERNGIKVLNDRVINRYANQKFTVYYDLTRRDVSVVPSCLIHNCIFSEYASMFRSIGFTPPFVVKPDILANGRGVALVRSQREFIDYMEATAMFPMDYVAQMLIRQEGPLKHDFRVFVAKKRIRVVTRRENEHELCSNWSKGGSERVIELDPATRDFATRIISVLGGDFYSLDIVPDTSGTPYLNEIEVNPDPDDEVASEVVNLYEEKVGALAAKLAS